MSARRRQRGFSLLEVLVAFAVLALTLGVLMQVFSGAVSATFTSGVYSRAAALAESRLNAVGIDIPLEAGSFTGELEDGLSWMVVIEPYESVLEGAESAAYTPYLVTAEAVWGDGGRERRVSLITLRLGHLL